jgi:hypothetical protein
MSTKNDSLSSLRNGLIVLFVIPILVAVGIFAMDPDGALDYFDKHESTRVTILIKKQLGRGTGPVSVSWSVFGSPPTSGSAVVSRATLRKTFDMNVVNGVNVVIKISGRTWTSCSVTVNKSKGNGHPLSWENPGTHVCTWP